MSNARGCGRGGSARSGGQLDDAFRGRCGPGILFAAPKSGSCGGGLRLADRLVQGEQGQFARLTRLRRWRKSVGEFRRSDIRRSCCETGSMRSQARQFTVSRRQVSRPMACRRLWFRKDALSRARRGSRCGGREMAAPSRGLADPVGRCSVSRSSFKPADCRPLTPWSGDATADGPVARIGSTPRRTRVMLRTVRKVEITLEDTVVMESRVSSRKRRAKVPDEVRRAGTAAVCQYLAFRTRQPGRGGSPFVVEHIEVATC